MQTAWIACGILLAAPVLGAGVIRLETAVLTHADPHETAVFVVLRNAGDEPAHRIAIEGRLAGHVVTRPPFDLEPGGSADDELILPFDAPETGTRVAELRLRYRDRNGYPFSAVTVGRVAFGGEARPSPVFARLQSATIREAGRLEVRLRLPDGETPRPVRLRYLVPDDLGCEAPDRTVTLFPGRLTVAAAALSNRTGRAGSVYPVFAIIREEGPEGVREQAVRGAVTLADAGAGRVPWIGLGAGGAALLVALFILRQAGGRAGGSNGV